MTKTHILLVDDDIQLAEIFKMSLEIHGYELSTAHDGHAALEKVSASLPDVIILDVMLPGINGHDVCRTLKSNIKTKHIPIILYSSLETNVQIEVGADAYMHKPVEVKDLNNKIEELLN
jgi:twitching motility two-component system response regulator PilH